MNYEWQLWEEINGYYVWVRGTSSIEKPAYSTVWNVTRNGNPPRTWGGYYNREEMYKLKGI